MPRRTNPRFDVASALSQGRRAYQEDALVTDFPIGDDMGLVVLADGMGGHAAGDVASKVVVTEVYGALKRQLPDLLADGAKIPEAMTKAAARANATVREHVRAKPDRRGMGATLVSLVLRGAQMYWTSIGDSPLYVLRGGRLSQLNEDHSMGPQIDLMVRAGLLTPEAGRDHPDRRCLTSAILGRTVSRVDCPPDPFRLEAGDIVVVSSDGLQFLEHAALERLVHRNRRRTAAEIAGTLLSALEGLSEPDQDNVSFSVVKVMHVAPLCTNPVMAMPGERMRRGATRFADMGKLADYAQALFASGRREAAPPASLTAPAPRLVLPDPNNPKPSGA